MRFDARRARRRQGALRRPERALRTRPAILRISLTGIAFCVLGLLFWEFQSPGASPLRALQLLPASIPPGREGGLVGRPTVVDGDTLDLAGRRVRLSGIDAPELGQSCRARNGRPYRCGRQAAEVLADRLRMATLHCTETGTDRHGRILAVCRANGEDIGAWMVGRGWALAYRRYSGAYVAEEAQARTARRGVWQGSIESPEDWRLAN